MLNMPVSQLHDISIIKEILPHRSPFLFVDRVIKLKIGKKIIAEKSFSQDDWFFAGHFPGKPILPGVIVSEALAQTSGLLLGLTWKDEGRFANYKKRNLFLSNVSMKFTTVAKPGEVLRLESTLKKNMEDYSCLM